METGSTASNGAHNSSYHFSFLLFFVLVFELSGGIKPQHQFQKASASPSNPHSGMPGPPKSQVPIIKPSVNPTTIPDSMVKAAAVAAGARIATSADASSLIEAAARSQNVVHITTGGSSAMKSSTTSMTSQLPSNVHFMRSGQSKTPIPAHSANRRTSESQAQGNSRPAELAVQPNPVLANATASIPPIEVPKTAGVDRSKEKVDKHQTSASGKCIERKPRIDQTFISLSKSYYLIQDDQIALFCYYLRDRIKALVECRVTE